MQETPTRRPGLLAQRAAGAYPAICEDRMVILPAFADTSRIPRASVPASDNSLASQREGSGGRVMAHTQRHHSKRGQPAPIQWSGHESPAAPGSNRSHQEGEGDILASALGTAHSSFTAYPSGGAREGLCADDR